MYKNLTKSFFLLVFIVISVQSGLGKSNEKLGMSSKSIHDHGESALGIHGMVLINVGERFIASHLPLHHPIHKYQLVFEVDVALPQKVERDELITLLPEKFDLLDLGEGAKRSFNSIIYKGHFERGGEAIGRAKVKVKEVLLFKEINEETNGFGYYQVALEDGSLLVIHKIQARPSFDQIFHLHGKLIDKNQKARGNYFKSDSRETASTLANRYGLNEENVKSIYLETQDFQ